MHPSVTPIDQGLRLNTGLFLNCVEGLDDASAARRAAGEPLARLSPPARRAGMVIALMIAITGLAGRDLVGNTLSSYVSGYSLFAWTVLLLFLFAVSEAGNEQLCSPGPG